MNKASAAKIYSLECDIEYLERKKDRLMELARLPQAQLGTFERVQMCIDQINDKYDDILTIQKEAISLSEEENHTIEDLTVELDRMRHPFKELNTVDALAKMGTLVCGLANELQDYLTGKER